MPVSSKTRSKSSARRRYEVGSVATIPIRTGEGCFQLVGRDPVLGELIRVLPGAGGVPPTLRAVGTTRERFFVFFPFTTAANRGLIAVKGIAPIPPGSGPPRLMRRAGGRDRQGKVLNWRILGGANERLVSELTPAERCLSLSEVWNDTLLAERIADDWTPDREG